MRDVWGDRMRSASIVGRIRVLQAALVHLLKTRPGPVETEPSSTTAIRLKEIEELGSSAGEVDILLALLAGLQISGVAWELRPGWWIWTGNYWGP